MSRSYAPTQIAGGVLRLFPTGTAQDPDGTLRLGGCRVDELAAAYGTPALVIDEEHLRATARRYRVALADQLPYAQATFASKAFPCTAVYRVMAEEGIWVDVAGHGELELALGAGVAPETLLLHGNAKSEAEIAAAVRAGVGLIVVDNLDDLDRIERHAERPVGVLLRLNPDVVPDTHAALNTGAGDSKFGLPLELARLAVERALASPLLTLEGVHIHIGSQILETAVFAESVRALSSLLERLGLGGLAVYDLGGGLGVPYTRDEAAPSIEEYVAVLARAVRRHLPADARILIEPGRSLVAAAGVSLYRATTVKRTGTTFVAIDGGMGDNLEVSLYGQRFEAVLAQQATAGDRVSELCDVVGHHCEAGDRLVAGAELPRPEVGDLIAVPVTGAYTYSMSNNYNGALRPPVVFAAGGEHYPVVRRETFADLVRRDLAPPR